MKYLLLLGLLLSSVTSVYAQTDNSVFNIRFFAGTDTTPPTTPVLVSTNPVSPTQIDLSWTAATDDFSFGGYVITRGSSTLATTTLTTFSDTSVVASTTYSYSVQAFDSVFNYSSSSNTISTTTPDYPVIPPSDNDSSSEGTVARIVTREVEVTTSVSAADISAATARPVRLTVRWGRSDDYELGYSISEYYSTTHEISLSDLEPGTKYEYEIIATTPFGLESVIKAGQFTTLSATGSGLPTNVGRFSATADSNDVLLSWQRPAGEDVAFVRIVRSNFGFPEYPQNGALVYQGLGTQFTDIDILEEYSPVYYTAFVYSTDGKVSSGAVAIAFAQSSIAQPNTDVQGGVPVTDSPPEKVNEATSTIEEGRYTVDMRLPELSDIFVQQSEEKYSFLDSDIVLSARSSFSVQVPVESVAGNLKSIIGTLLDPTDNTKSYSFLLRVNEDASYYEAVIPPLHVTGDSVLEVKIYDYEALVVATYKSPLRFIEKADLLAPVLFPDVFFRFPVNILLVSVLVGVLFLLLLLIFRYRHEDKG
jgi:hypothetical protein